MDANPSPSPFRQGIQQLMVPVSHSMAWIDAVPCRLTPGTGDMQERWPLPDAAPGALRGWRGAVSYR